tara:strand:- start:6201 stop:6665 length:465 start_codon:yes stop_codon:yes gene_type:complete
MAEPTIEKLLDEFDITTIQPTTPDPARQLVSDRRAITVARCHGNTTRAEILRATSLPAERYKRATAEAESEMEIRDQLVERAYRAGLKTAAAICKRTRIGGNRVRSAARRLGLKLADGRQRSKSSPEVVHRRNLERRARERQKKEAVDACRGRR